MSNDGSSGGLHGGPPPADDPWLQADPYRPAVDPYHQPAPYGEPSVSHGYAGSGSYGSASPEGQEETQAPSFGEKYLPPGWDLSPPPPRPPKPSGGTGLIITLIVILAVVLCGGVAGGFYLINVKGSPNASASSTAHQTASPAVSPTRAAQISKGDCVVNKGTDDKHPQLALISCGPGVYQVLARFDGTIDTGKCITVTGATHDYVYQTTPDSQDFVLCLKLQP
jgi:hypothetical protein